MGSIIIKSRRISSIGSESEALKYDHVEDIISRRSKSSIE
jgi:hypothetical protein